MRIRTFGRVIATLMVACWPFSVPHSSSVDSSHGSIYASCAEQFPETVAENMKLVYFAAKIENLGGFYRATISRAPDDKDRTQRAKDRLKLRIAETLKDKKWDSEAYIDRMQEYLSWCQDSFVTRSSG